MRKSQSSSPLETLVLVHFCTLLIFTSWAFGGQAPWARQVIAVLGGVGVVLFIIACLTRDAGHESGWKAALRLLWPLWIYDVIVIISCFNPSFREIGLPGDESLAMIDPISWLPSAARPKLAARELWQFNAIVLSCYNLYLMLPSRRAVRKVLLTISINAVVLAVFGTFQKLIKAKGLWLGLVPSPNDKFFSTFIYHNHWGAFTILNTTACLALLFYFLRRGGHRDIWHSPLPLGLMATLLLAISVPLSSSRSCTVQMAILLFGAFVHLLVRVIKRRRQMNESPFLPIAGIALAAVLSLGAIGYLARDVIAQRSRLTSEQLTTLAKEDTMTARIVLYKDTWRMAAEKPVFGWGLESYAHAFRIFNTQRAAEMWIWITFYAEAHNDWLQSLAEVGFVGTTLLLLLGLLPLFAVPWRRVESTVPRYLLAGCSLILLYAWLEFPFANPAVMLTFCALFYCAIRYALLDTQNQDDSTR
ncbi:O-antigen ligase family protein [Oleiharenicola lentus]|uniref:O-antigen ligase family protein n=1 Tax=Oleiharenicola lentus TaxID=2508720 RepID=UPI003F67B6B4